MAHPCDRCGEDTDDDKLIEVEDDEWWCTDCENLRKFSYFKLEDELVRLKIGGEIGFD